MATDEERRAYLADLAAAAVLRDAAQARDLAELARMAALTADELAWLAKQTLRLTPGTLEGVRLVPVPRFERLVSLADDIRARYAERDREERRRLDLTWLLAGAPPEPGPRGTDRYRRMAAGEIAEGGTPPDVADALRADGYTLYRHAEGGTHLEAAMHPDRAASPAWWTTAGARWRPLAPDGEPGEGGERAERGA